MKGKLRMSPYRKAREELLSGKVATRIQALADLEAAIRADQRRIDAEAAPEFPLPIRADGTHFYVSTYCLHGDHAACRLRCKTCNADCLCGCGHPLPIPVMVDDRRCACGDPIVWMDHPDDPGWIHAPGSDTPCLDARPDVATPATPPRTTPDNPVTSGDAADKAGEP